MDAQEIAQSILTDCQFRDNGKWYEFIDEFCGGSSTDGGFNITVGGRNFYVEVHEYEPEDLEW